MENISSHTGLFARGCRTMAWGWGGAAYCRRYGRELVTKPAISLKKSLGGYRSKTPFMVALQGVEHENTAVFRLVNACVFAGDLLCIVGGCQLNAGQVCK